MICDFNHLISNILSDIKRSTVTSCYITIDSAIIHVSTQSIKIGISGHINRTSISSSRISINKCAIQIDLHFERLKIIIKINGPSIIPHCDKLGKNMDSSPVNFSPIVLNNC